MPELRDRLQTLVGYWIEHTQEHEEEMRQWADKAGPLGAEVAHALLAAAENLSRAADSLKQAKSALQNKAA